MAENAEFVFTEEQQQLRAAVRKFCADNFDESTVRRLMESEVPFDAKVWNRLGAELGVLGLSVPEDDGGVEADKPEDDNVIPVDFTKKEKLTKNTKTRGAA